MSLTYSAFDFCGASITEFFPHFVVHPSSTLLAMFAFMGLFYTVIFSNGD